MGGDGGVAGVGEVASSGSRGARLRREDCSRAGPTAWSSRRTDDASAVDAGSRDIRNVGGGRGSAGVGGRATEG
eukprot:1122830-Pleurochrysis_carterae.AAC.1